mgnify:CR=1 FL=1|tara:strand:- start:2526 stop:3041 length:516 start_codon:yes stop_codon:yes gene_type:complete
MATLGPLNDFTAGTTIVAADMNQNFTDIETFVNTTPGVVQKDIVDAKGDLIVATSADAVSRLAVGTNDYVLTAASGEATGVKWASAPADATKMPLAGGTFTGAVTYQGASPILLTGATTGNGYETTITVTDPTADRTLTLPNATGTVALTSDIPTSVNGTSDNIISNQVFS